MRSRPRNNAWAFDVLERKLEPLLDLHAPLEQARSDLGGVQLEMRRPGDGHREESGISGPFGSFERRMAVGDGLGDLGTDQAIEGSIARIRADRPSSASASVRASSRSAIVAG